ncbi:MAG: LamG-like jellyroll fold domain-containing protein, partial [Bacteroidia bacterium]
MKKIVLIYILLAVGIAAMAQNIGDTIKVKTFHYGSNNRDTVAFFPNNNLSYEKIILKYNMRCKNGLVSNSTNRDQGCGEWDYSCNTYIVDSAKVEEVLSTQPNYVVTNFSGNSFKYTITPPFNYYLFNQKQVIVDSVIQENLHVVGNGSIQSHQVFDLSKHSGKSQFIINSNELMASGLSAGPIKGLVLYVNGNAANASFLKIKMKQDSLGVFDLNKSNSIGFTEVYFNHTSFVNGSNYLRFHTPFNWDGSRNIIVELSYTNAVESVSASFLADSLPFGATINAYNNFALDLKNQGFVRLDASNFSSINKELSIQFWAYGDEKLMPITTSILYGYNVNMADRQLNIHLPHISNNVYFDCGFSGGYDRINKIATAAEQGGRWNHWTFTKNATTGNMKIFLNGVLWFSGTGKTKAITLLNLLLGKDQNGGANYKGKINKLMVWDKELPDTTIANWMNRIPNANHPFYSDLLSYYPMNEGDGNAIKNQITNVLLNGENFSWTYDRGEALSRDFELHAIRPKMAFITGDYVSSVQNIIAKDSVQIPSVLVQKYKILSKAAQVPLASDEARIDTIFTSLYPAYYSKTFQGETGALLDSSLIQNDGEFQISNLNFYRRFPFYNEIMSFVTPYGIGLNFGQNGRTWYFDVTDFAPILKGNKRILMTLGGQNQEQMDLEFWFVVGTPPRPVLEFNQIWQGTNRTGAAGIASINNNTRYSAVSVPTLSNGKSFKIRSTITGHGAEGEFEANGGVINHMLNINGGDTD